MVILPVHTLIQIIQYKRQAAWRKYELISWIKTLSLAQQLRVSFQNTDSSTPWCLQCQWKIRRWIDRNPLLLSSAQTSVARGGVLYYKLLTLFPFLCSFLCLQKKLTVFSTLFVAIRTFIECTDQERLSFEWKHLQFRFESLATKWVFFSEITNSTIGLTSRIAVPLAWSHLWFSFASKQEEYWIFFTRPSM